ncbi:putative glycoside hydrolase family 18 protein [Phaeoacremonium minimum UCRPA7]|uniref:chitinase n=1 Tax=Phaeoacremonium minimum (strain UCR-PA7) TaxID=1286976 RepID=R8BBJ3_PHAM7|nr:putative glycoside hydrolase family 18 protein [Phaeoacremonium minimum UCRPA7]EON96665.1 putative glycoside hydrolase family 18 protein [Phaeoacremonium minimum UCRPA7]
MPPLPHPPLPRIITYYQTHHDKDGKPISVLPLLTQPHVGITHVILAALHLNEDPAAMTLNDHHPKDPRFTTLWAEMRVLQASGVKVLLMLGGAARGSYERLDSDDAKFERYYLPMRDLIRERALDGIDLDVEEEMSLGGIIRLIDRIRADFGPDFLITMAPVAAALLDSRKNMSGFDYEALEVMRGKDIAWYNAQFYCGWGDCSNPVMYEMIIYKGWKPEKVVVGLLTSPENGNGWTPWEALANVIPLLLGRHARFGGVMGWEYFNSLPGGRERPWEWAQWMTTVLKGRRTESQEMVAPSGNVVAVPAAEKIPETRDADEGDGEAEVPQSFEYYSDGAAED